MASTITERLVDIRAWAAAQLCCLRREGARQAGLLRGWDGLARILALLTIVIPCLIVTWPWWQDTSTYGFHDWDVQTSHRYLAKQSILEHGELPGWNPYACGGFPAWGYVEGATIVASPWLPAYLLLDIRTALRIEVLGMALVGAIGSFLAAGRFTSSLGARAIVVALFAVNGRWGLQTASGHTWHLAYALVPWALWAFEGARARPLALRSLIALGVTLAMLVYAGGIYPLPHAVLLLSLWAVLVALLERSGRPLLVLAAGGAIGVGLSAPKLFPLLATFERAPRLIESKEWLDLGSFWTLLTSRQQGFFDRPAPVRPYGWHEWGMYVSLPGALLLGLGVLLVGGKKEALLKLVGVTFLVLGFGAFHEQAPWSWLHQHVPVFKSHHVPARFLYPAVLVLALVLASGLGALVSRLQRRHRFADAALAACALALGVDVASVAQKPMKEAMWMKAPDVLARGTGEFHFEKEPPFHYKRRDWAGPMYLAMLGRTGVLNCYGAPPFEGRGALGVRDPGYRGEVVAEPAGRASLEAWSPNAASVVVHAAPPGARLVYNMNFDPGWNATVTHAGRQEEPAVEPSANRVSVALPEGDSSVRFFYRPPGLRLGLVVFVITCAALTAIGVRRRRSGAEA